MTEFTGRPSPMTRLFLAPFLLIFFFTGFTYAEPTLVGATFNKMYVPTGFDSNDNVQFVGEGRFRNTCYRPAPGSLKIDEATKTITVGPVAYEYSGFCLQLILPFQRVIDVGILKPGIWRVVEGVPPSVTMLGEIQIARALTESADDYLYAPISQAYFQQQAGWSSVLLSGEFASNCLKLDSVKVIIQKEVIVLQPIAKLEPFLKCVEHTTHFSKRVSLPNLKPGRYLLHVRSMNGNAINSLVNVE